MGQEEEPALGMFATAWGPRHGGINAFNTDLCEAIGRFGDIPIFCIVDEASHADIIDAETRNVQLIRNDTYRSSMDKGHRDWFWVGHDTKTGPQAIRAKEDYGGRSVIIHHMDYSAYAVLNYGDIEAHEKTQGQREIFRAADFTFGVGPHLQNSLRLLGVPNPSLIIPGLPEIDVNSIRCLTPSDRFRVFVSARVSERNDRVKQVTLSVIATANALSKMRPENTDWEMLIFGLAETPADNAFAKALHERAKDRAKRFFPLKVLPFELDRERLFEELRYSSIALMPSLREGFGLVAWEAMAAGVPTVISVQSGIYKFMQSRSLTPYFESIDVRGGGEDEPNAEDVSELSDRIEDVALGRETARNNAVRLREFLREDPSLRWSVVAREFIRSLGIQKRLPAVGRRLQRDGASGVLEAIHSSPSPDVQEVFFELYHYVQRCPKKSEAAGKWLDLVQAIDSVTGLAILYSAARACRLVFDDRDFFSRTGKIGSERPAVDWVAVQEGTFRPGSDVNVVGRDNDEGPFATAIVRPFMMAKTTVTNEVYAHFDRGHQHYTWKGSEVFDLSQHPVVYKNWWEANLFAHWMGADLPTEKEWEFACGLGRETELEKGNEAAIRTANLEGLSRAGGPRSPRTVSAKEARSFHPLGLNHMHGNVWEWTKSVYSVDNYNSSDGFADDGINPKYRIVKGGAWDTDRSKCRSAYRYRIFQDARHDHLGLRLVRRVE